MKRIGNFFGKHVATLALMGLAMSPAFSSAATNDGINDGINTCGSDARLYQRFNTMQEAEAVCQSGDVDVRVSYDYYFHQYVCICEGGHGPGPRN